MKTTEINRRNLKHGTRLILLLGLFFMAGYGTMAAIVQLFGS